jgi:hypothetical protein
MGKKTYVTSTLMLYFWAPTWKTVYPPFSKNKEIWIHYFF